VSVQATGCAPVVRAFEAGAVATEPWADPVTAASGLRVPAPLGGALMLRALRETDGHAVAVTDDALLEAATRIAGREGLDVGPEGGAAIAALEALSRTPGLPPARRVVIFNTGAGWLYR
jgi:threonine synthase